MENIVKNKVIERYVGCNKQIEKRMEGSAGSIYYALVETLLKEDYYFSGVKFDEGLVATHVLTNNPEDLPLIVGYKPVACNFEPVCDAINNCLLAGNKVVFCGTQDECNQLVRKINQRDNLLLIDIIHSPFVSQEDFRKYIEDVESDHASKVVDVRFYNKEFLNIHSKRIVLANGKTIYTQEDDSFENIKQGNIENHEAESLDYRIGDITLGAYNMDKSHDDGLGFSYISVNSPRGSELLKKAQKRLSVVKTGEEVCVDRVVRYEKSNVNNHKISTLKTIALGWLYAQGNLSAFSKFLKLNFFSKAVKTDKYNNGFVYVSPNCAMKLVDGCLIELHGPLKLGNRRIRDSKEETRLRLEKGAKLLVRKSCTIGAGSNVEIYKDATLDIGQLNSNAELNIICGDKITIGTPCNIARNASVRDTSGHMIAIPGYRQTRPVTIGNHTWICSNATIMPGVTVGDGSIIGANAFVSKKVPSFSMVQGNPSEVVCPVKYFKI